MTLWQWHFRWRKFNFYLHETFDSSDASATWDRASATAMPKAERIRGEAISQNQEMWTGIPFAICETRNCELENDFFFDSFGLPLWFPIPEKW